MLHFPGALEARFEHDTGASRARYLAITAFILLSFNILFIVRDRQIIGDVYPLAVLARFGIAAVGYLGCIVLWNNPRPWLREGLDGAVIIFGVAAMLYVYASSRSPLVAHAHYSLVLLVIFPNIIQRLRFWYATTASTLAIVLCAIAIPHFEAMPREAVYGAILTLATAASLTLFANWQFEHDERRQYLLNLREMLIGEHLSGINRELSAASVHDPLTGLGNRRRLDQFVDALWLARRGGRGPVAFLMIDVDFFKSFNDAYGHQAGDECLKAVAAATLQQLRTGKDLAVRYGGEEFLIVLPETDLEEAIQIAERIRGAIERRAIARPHAVTGDIVTVSIGAAAVSPDESESSTAAIAAADAAMYAAKEQGRNCVRPSPSPTKRPEPQA